MFWQHFLIGLVSIVVDSDNQIPICVECLKNFGFVKLTFFKSYNLKI